MLAPNGTKRCDLIRKGNHFWRIFFALRYVPTENISPSPKMTRLSYFRSKREARGAGEDFCVDSKIEESGLVSYLEELGGPSRQWTQCAFSSWNPAASRGTRETNGQGSPGREKSMAARFSSSSPKPPFYNCAERNIFFKLALRRGQYFGRLFPLPKAKLVA